MSQPNQEYNPFQGYEEYAKTIKQDVEFAELQRLCHELFLQSESGKKLWELMDRKVIANLQVDVNHPKMGELAIFLEGKRSGIREFIARAHVHHQFVLAHEASQKQNIG